MKKLFSKIRFVAVELVKGVAPGASPVVKIVEHFTRKDLATGQPIEGGTDWGKVIVRLTGVAILTYLVLNDYIPVADLIKIIKGLI